MLEFVSGLITMGFFIAGVFFLRFWTRTGDQLFAAFSAAFCLLGINQALLVFAPFQIEERSWLYLLRLAAFILIIAAVIAKNRHK